jgi:hypothetical protein
MRIFFRSIHRKLDRLLMEQCEILGVQQKILCGVRFISRELSEMSDRTDRLAAAITALTSSVSTLTTNVATNQTEVLKEIDQLKEAFTNDDGVAFDAAIDKITALTGAIATQADEVAQQTIALQSDNPAAPTDPVDPPTGETQN